MSDVSNHLRLKPSSPIDPAKKHLCGDGSEDARNPEDAVAFDVDRAVARIEAAYRLDLSDDDETRDIIADVARRAVARYKLNRPRVPRPESSAEAARRG